MAESVSAMPAKAASRDVCRRRSAVVERAIVS
jgi:hypothetical protein